MSSMISSKHLISHYHYEYNIGFYPQEFRPYTGCETVTIYTYINIFFLSHTVRNTSNENCYFSHGLTGDIVMLRILSCAAPLNKYSCPPQKKSELNLIRPVQ